MTVLTPLPGGGNAEHAWASTTDVMRQVLLRATAAPDSPVPVTHPRTLRGLVQRELIALGAVGMDYYVTRRGQVLVEWARDRELL